jgi:hypothetical protein
MTDNWKQTALTNGEKMARKKNLSAAALGFCGALWAGSALAEDFECLYFGAEFEDLRQASAVALARIGGGSPRVNFVKRDAVRKGCPSSSLACREKAYLVPGDEVVVSGVKGEFVCVSYVDGKGRVTDGWLPGAAVTVVQDSPAVQPRDWVGQWQSGPEQTIVIKPASKPDHLRIEGDATWGASDPERVKRGAFNIGELEGEVAPEGQNLSFGMGENGTVAFDKADAADCKVQMRRLGSYLLAKDNGMCGGHNVSFSGVYRRLK